MIIGKFGDKVFEVSQNRIYTPRDISISGDLNTSEEDSSGKKPSTTIKGTGLTKVSIELQLLAAAGVDVRSEIDSWTAVKDSATAYALILCGKAVGLNKFLLTGCGASDLVITKASGLPVAVSAVLKLEFLEYVRPGAQKSAAAKGKAAKGVAAGLAGQVITNPYKMPSSVEKSTAKRTNEGMNGR